MSVQPFDSLHEDLIHDVAYDFYGKRFVTCSSDQKLKVWEFSQDTNNWELVDSWKAHESSILKVAWAHPEFGQVIASCSFDRSIRIWEEQEHELKNSGKRWLEKARLIESKGSVQDIAFAPNFLGLRLASIAADGVLRIFEALEVSNLAHWTLMDEVHVHVSRSSNPPAFKEAEENYCLSWCPSRYQSPMIVIGCGKENNARIFRCDQNNKWRPCEVLDGHEDLVNDVDWAPNMGRSYHLIATASKDHRVRIYKLLSNKDGFKVELVADLNDHRTEVWKVKWNVTGTILSSAGDDGKVRLWKAGNKAENEEGFKCIGIVCNDRQSNDTMEI
ncbi:WD40-repeat-containing domain protein [Glomus cerebriforme]|uniref:WD40-repeat-containing domain protein n=1 Tax=Glomus cerebriforme TaxID=658196 RepID=A0A397TMN1_9GLOM|nr:WD40-repeat-containing domain protein [Glomus cerebriforme]